MMQASFASGVVSWNVLGPHLLFGRVRCPFEGPNSQNDRQFVTALNDDRLGDQRLGSDRAGRTIQRCFQKPAGFKVANEKPFVLDLDIVVENNGRRRSTRTRNGGYFDQAPGERSENTLFFSAQLASV
jgi:hypothetical protein